MFKESILRGICYTAFGTSFTAPLIAAAVFGIGFLAAAFIAFSFMGIAAAAAVIGDLRDE